MEKEAMWYDERYYLEEENVYDRKPIYDLQKDVIFLKKIEDKTNSHLIEKYDSFIEKVSHLIRDISLKDNSLSSILSTGILLNHGMFSTNGKLVYDNTSIDTLRFNLGIDVIRGKACCRHFSAFIDDVMKNLDIKSNIFPCIYTDIYSETTLASKKVSHMANLVYYNGIPYVYDALNDNTFFSFVDEFKAMTADRISPIYYYYKPYFDMFYERKSLKEVKQQLEIFRKSVGRSITEKEFLEIERETNEKLERDMDLIYDFILDTDKDLKTMDVEIEKVIKKQIIKK